MPLIDSSGHKLPDELSAWIHSQWLGIREAVKLEAAVVRAADRMKVLKHCFDDGFVHTFVQCKSYRGQFCFMEWLMKRSLLVTAISIPDEAELDDRIAKRFLHHCGHHLKRVEFNGNGKENQGRIINEIAVNCKYLEEFKITYWHKIKESAIWRLLMTNRHIHSIDFSRCTDLSDQSMQSMARHCPQLRSLCLQGCTSITDLGVANIAAACRQIQHVNFSDTKLRGNGVMLIVNHRRDLRSLKMRFLKENAVPIAAALPQINLGAIALQCRHLHTIDVSQIPSITGTDIEAFVRETAGRLLELHVNDVQGVDDTTMQAIAEHCPLLMHLSVSQCSLVSNAGVLAIIQGCKQLQKIALTGNSNVTEEVRAV